MVYTVNPAPLFVNWSVSPINKDLVKRNPDVKDLLLRTIRDSFYAGIMGGFREMVNRTIKWRGKGVVPSPQILLSAMKLLLTGLITVLKNKDCLRSASS